MPKTYGYIRVSTRAQREERQRIALRQAGVANQNIFVDTATGKHFDRPAYRRLLCRLRQGDLLVEMCIRDSRQALRQEKHGAIIKPHLNQMSSGRGEIPHRRYSPRAFLADPLQFRGRQYSLDERRYAQRVSPFFTCTKGGIF